MAKAIWSTAKKQKMSFEDLLGAVAIVVESIARKARLTKEEKSSVVRRLFDVRDEEGFKFVFQRNAQ